MKVKDLIIELQKHDQEAEVMVEGLELGVSDVRKVVPVTVYKNIERPWWAGRYSTSLDDDDYYEIDSTPINAVLLPRLDNEDSDEDWAEKSWAKMRADRNKEHQENES